MLRSIIEDFKILGYRIITQVDERIILLTDYLYADEIYTVNSNNAFIDVYKQCLNKVNNCFIIAPEFSNILYNLTQIANNLHKHVISIGLDGIKLGASKIETYNFFKKNNLKTPLTFLIPSLEGKFDLNFINDKFNKYKFPFIIKPDDGVGAESIYFFKTITDLKDFFSNPDIDFNFDRSYILQEYIEGNDYSLSLITKPLKGKLRSITSILSINSQNIKDKHRLGTSFYTGGSTPIPKFAHVKKKITKLIKNVDLNHFNGYFGIDFIATNKEEFYFIEINPRLTTSYVGVRKICKDNILSLLEENYNKKTRVIIKHTGFSDFLRIDLKYNGTLTFNEISNVLLPRLMKEIPELVTPPVNMNNSDLPQNLNFSCFIATKSKNSIYSKARILEIKNTLKENQFAEIK